MGLPNLVRDDEDRKIDEGWEDTDGAIPYGSKIPLQITQENQRKVALVLDPNVPEITPTLKGLGDEAVAFSQRGQISTGDSIIPSRKQPVAEKIGFPGMIAGVDKLSKTAFGKYSNNETMISKPLRGIWIREEKIDTIGKTLMVSASEGLEDEIQNLPGQNYGSIASKATSNGLRTVSFDSVNQSTLDAREYTEFGITDLIESSKLNGDFSTTCMEVKKTSTVTAMGAQVLDISKNSSGDIVLNIENFGETHGLIAVIRNGHLEIPDSNYLVLKGDIVVAMNHSMIRNLAKVKMSANYTEEELSEFLINYSGILLTEIVELSKSNGVIDPIKLRATLQPYLEKKRPKHGPTDVINYEQEDRDAINIHGAAAMQLIEISH